MIAAVTGGTPSHGQAPLPARPVQLPLSGRQAGEVIVQQSAEAPSGASTNVRVQIQGAYAGSIAAVNLGTDTIELTLSDALKRGLKANLGIVNSGINLDQSRAQVAEARSALLPRIDLEAAENAAKLNLAAQGFSADALGGGLGPAFPKTVGPFHYYDLHGAFQQSVVDITATRNFKTQGKVREAALRQAGQAREEVVLAVAGVYLQLLADRALLDRQQAEVAYAEASYHQASAQADAGNKAPIEANRSLVELQTEKQRLRSQMGEVTKRQIQLARIIGLSPGTHIQLREELIPLSSDLEPLEDLLRRAFAQRQDLKAAEAQLNAAEDARKAASAQRFPTVSISGTYGIQGINFNGGNAVFQASGGLTLPIFHGGQISADISQADAAVKQRRAEVADEHGSVEAELRVAYVNVQVANDQVVLADSNRRLATETLQQSQDRFAVGVADSVEVVNSQQALAAADHDFVTSLFSQHIAKITLAHATGEAEQQLPELFERKAQ